MYLRKVIEHTFVGEYPLRSHQQFVEGHVVKFTSAGVLIEELYCLVLPLLRVLQETAEKLPVGSAPAEGFAFVHFEGEDMRRMLGHLSDLSFATDAGQQLLVFLALNKHVRSVVAVAIEIEQTVDAHQHRDYLVDAHVQRDELRVLDGVADAAYKCRDQGREVGVLFG